MSDECWWVGSKGQTSTRFQKCLRCVKGLDAIGLYTTTNTYPCLVFNRHWRIHTTQHLQEKKHLQNLWVKASLHTLGHATSINTNGSSSEGWGLLLLLLLLLWYFRYSRLVHHSNGWLGFLKSLECCGYIPTFEANTLHKTNSSALQIGLPKRTSIFQPSIFRGHVSFREGMYLWRWIIYQLFSPKCHWKLHFKLQTLC